MCGQEAHSVGGRGKSLGGAAAGGPPESIRNASGQYAAGDLPRAELDARVGIPAGVFPGIADQVFQGDAHQATSSTSASTSTGMSKGSSTKAMIRRRSAA